MLLQSGTRIGPYELKGTLGAGGMGEVYRARDSRLGRDVAIKSLPAGVAEDAERRARFEREAQALAALSHPHIAAIFGLEESAGVPYLVLELVEGETLAARLERGSLPLADALRIGVQIASAIETAHERGIIHRDLKPGNVMLDAAGNAKVLDFGLAKWDGDSRASAELTGTPSPQVTALGLVVGTVAYMSPEQARGQAVDRRADVWSFGCVLFECLSGEAAFVGATASDLIARVLEREPDWSSLPAGTPPRVREILRRCLRKNASERPRDIRDVRLELAEAASTVTARTEDEREQSIAVLPFRNMSAPEDEYFADGVTEEILNALAQLDGLRVAARGSCFAFKGRHEDLRSVAEKLDVATVLEGSLRRAGQRLRITAQLVNAADGYQMWSERYDRELTDVFAVQDEIANAIATRLRVTFHDSAARGKNRRGTHSLEAYELLLKGRALQLQRGQFIFDAIACFEKALALEPNYADALGSLTDSYRLLGTYGAVPFAECMPRAKELAQQALALDPDNVESLATLADVECQYDRNVERAQQLWQRALTLDPRHTRARAEGALWLYCCGVHTAEVALAETQQAMAYDPLNPWVVGMTCFAFGFAGRHDEAIAEGERASALDPKSFWTTYQLGRALALGGHYERAIQQMKKVLVSHGRNQWSVGTMGWLYAQAGDAGRARAVYDELEARSRQEFIAPFWLSVAAEACGEHEEAMRYAGRSFTERDPLFLHGLVLPFWDGVRADPRFAALREGLWR